MEYDNKEIFNTAKKIVANMQDLKEESITEDACSFCWDLDFDSLDQYEFMLEMEKHYKVYIENKDVEIFEQTTTLKEFCDTFCDYLNPKEINSKNDVFKILDRHLRDKYDIMNARPTDNFFIDLHFQDFDRSELITWADKKFNIVLPRTYFINLDDFCERIFYAIQRKKTHQLKTNKQQKTNLFNRAKQRFNSLVQKINQHSK